MVDVVVTVVAEPVVIEAGTTVVEVATPTGTWLLVVVAVEVIGTICPLVISGLRVYWVVSSL